MVLMSRTLIAAVLSSLLIYYLAYRYLSRDKFRASILACVTIIATYTYGQLFASYQKLTNQIFGFKSGFEHEGYFSWLLVIVFVGLLLLIKNKLKYSKNIQNYLAVLVTVLLAFNMFPLVRHWITNANLNDIPFGQPVNAVKEVKATPDIYYLIFDRYANQSVLKSVYNLDNSQFLNGLKSKGFYVADSTANYPATSFSLSSSLNLDYLPSALQNRPENGLYASLLHDRMEDNRVVDFLKGRGYQFVNVGPWWDATKYNHNADLNLYNPTGFIAFNRSVDLQEHERILFEDTVLFALSKTTLKVRGRVLFGRTYPNDDSPSRAIHRQTAINQFRQLKKASNISGQKFVFAHFLMPHDPYVLDENCKHLPIPNEHEYKLYRRQIQCTNIKIRETIDYILSHSKTDPIIIIQSDEGPYPTEFRKNLNLEWSKARNGLLHQKAKITNNYYFPGRDYSNLYPHISPVNTFRVVFNQFFGTQMPLLKDKYYFSESTKKRFYLFEVTDRFK